ncbi:MAG: hypothetical protein D9C04_05355 [Nitrosopumilus sp. B06]|nr:MAG: hypothetical protein D9C04_05355 [Nitrosopumilus sp. B06]
MRPLLFDEMYEGKSEEFRQRGYQAISVRELRDMGLQIKHDFSIIKYADENKMILLTRDKESYGGCMENQITCVELGENPSIDDIAAKLEKFKDLP